MYRLLLVFAVLGSWPCSQPSVAAAPSEPDAVVAADGSGDFASIQKAVYAAPYRKSGPPWVIRVKPGVYEERVYVQRERGCLRLVGDDAERTVLSAGLHAHLPGPDGEPIGTFRTATLQIDGDGFEVENMTIENAAGPVGQALALRADGDRLAFRNCRFLGWQDTMLLNRGRHYFEDCTIKGHVDFIFGGATAWFEQCEIHCLKNGYITAASTPQSQEFGFVFHDCRISGADGVRTFLGRPWRPYAMTMFLSTQMSDVVRPEGWNNWGNSKNETTARYTEHASTGPGANPGGRVDWAGSLTETAAREISRSKVLAGKDNWDPTAR